MEDNDFLQRLERLIGEIESVTDTEVRERILGILLVVLDFHRRGLGQIMQHLLHGSGEHGRPIDQLLKEPLVRSLLLLHDLHPDDLLTRVRQAVAEHAAEWAKHGVRVEDISVTPEGRVGLKPDAAAIEIEGLDEADVPSSFVPLSALRISKRSAAVT